MKWLRHDNINVYVVLSASVSPRVNGSLLKKVIFRTSQIVLLQMSDYIKKLQQNATVCRYLFTAKSLYMFRATIAPIIRCT